MDFAGSRFVGGFFELEHAHAPLVPADRSIWHKWTHGRDWIGFENARSAFAALIEDRSPGRVWAPEYLCDDLTADLTIPVSFYPVTLNLTADASRIVSDAAEGDLVLAVSYFGAGVCENLRSASADRPDLIWVEDRAQTLEIPPQTSIPSAWHLYSPRKLLGVADGGLLVAPVGERLHIDLLPPRSGLDHAAKLRRNALSADQMSPAYRTYVEIEAGHRVTRHSISEQCRSILQSLDGRTLADRRRANFQVALKILRHRAAPIIERLAQSPAPFGFPVLIPNGRDDRLRDLAADGIFCPVHWRSLPIRPKPGSDAEALSRSMATVPIDHRYSPETVERVAISVEARLS